MMEFGIGSMEAGDWLATLICAGISLFLIWALYQAFREHKATTQERQSANEFLKLRYTTGKYDREDPGERSQNLEA